MKLSDFIIQYLENVGVKNVFLLSGGGMMHLLDSLGRSKKIICWPMHHEQAAAIAAQSSGIYNNKLGVCFVTTGPGASNAITGVAGAYYDSTPILVVSGQVKTADFASIRGVRQYGAQEIDIVNMVKPVTKYAVTVTDQTKIRYELERALYCATSARKGPVWIDIPLDIQNSEVDPDTLEGYTPPNEEKLTVCNQQIEEIYRTLNAAKHPVILMGHGICASESEDMFRRLTQTLQIPLLSTWRAKNIFADDEPLYYGSPGLQAARYSNIILQQSDVLVVLGSRLDAMITAFNEPHFAPRAKKIIVDIDNNEIMKLDMDIQISVHCDAKDFISAMLQHIQLYVKPEMHGWYRYCDKLKERYAITKEKQVGNVGIDLYHFCRLLSHKCTGDELIISSSTSRSCSALNLAFKMKKGQKIYYSPGLGGMGFTLPLIVGGCIESERRKTIAVEGEGSLQLNIQELQTIKTNNLPAKIFVYNNGGYAAIISMQDKNFEGRYVGSNHISGVEFPDLRKLCMAYDLPYYKIDRIEDASEIIEIVLRGDFPVICEVMGSPNFDEIPKCISRILPDGRMESAVLENAYPFLDDTEVNSYMTIE